MPFGYGEIVNMDLTLLFGFVCLTLGLSYFQIRQRKNYAFQNVLIVFLYLLLIGNRSIEGTADTPLYADEFSSVTLQYLYTPDNVDTLYRYEYGYSLLSQIIKFVFGDNLSAFFMIIALLQATCVYFGFRNFMDLYNKSSNAFILFIPCFAIYIAVAGFMYNAIVLRAGIAISLQFLATSLLLKRKYVQGTMFFCISLTFHNTAFIGLGILLFMLLNRVYSAKVYYAWLSSFLILYLLKIHVWISSITSGSLILLFSSNDDQTTSKLSNYLSNSSDSSSSYSIFIFINFALSYLTVRYSDLGNKLTNKLIRINLFSTCFLALMSAIPIVSRVFDYYLVFNVIVFYLCFIDKFNTYKGIIFSALVIALVFRFYVLALEPYIFYLYQ